MKIALIINMNIDGGLTQEEAQQLAENVATAIINMAENQGITPEESDAAMRKIQVEDATRELRPVVYTLHDGKYIKRD